MPIFRINDQLHYYAHVPKCAGAAIEDYLIARFGPLAFRDMMEGEVPKSHRWIRSSPQHVPVSALERLVPMDWLQSSFAVVRHPVRRLISAFFFARDVNGRLPLATDFNTWFTEAAGFIGKDPYRNGGHLEPQATFIPPGSRVFRLEDGIDRIIPYLDRLAGNEDGPRHVAPRNVGFWRSEEATPALTPQNLALVAEVYADDFSRYGYALPTNDAEVAALPDLPALAATGAPPESRKHSFRQKLLRSLYRKAGL